MNKFDFLNKLFYMVFLKLISACPLFRDVGCLLKTKFETYLVQGKPISKYFNFAKEA